jgi:ADP-ribosyl-[dinitrogen reductase] hydrolase
MKEGGSSFALAIVGTGRARGQIAITCCPGRAAGVPPLASEAARLLQRDVATIVRWSAQAVVTLLDDLELARLRVKALPSLLAPHGIAWYQVPLHPSHAPDPPFESLWRTVGPQLTAVLWRGGRVLIHCIDGKARAGLAAARLLVESGCTPQDAINRVRAARQGALEDPAQEEHVRRQSFPGGPAHPHVVLDLESGELVEPDWEPAAVAHIARRVSAG